MQIDNDNEEQAYFLLPKIGTAQWWASHALVSDLVRSALDEPFFRVPIWVADHAFYRALPEHTEEKMLDHTRWETEHLERHGFESVTEWVRSSYKHTLVTWTSKEHHSRLRCSLVFRETYQILETVELRREQAKEQLASLVKRFHETILEELILSDEL